MIDVQKVQKIYGKETVLKEVTHQFADGKVHGIVGNNGSGKTVLFKCICGFVKPTSGRILVNGDEIGKDCDFPKSIGIIIETPGFLPYQSGFRNLQILASLNRRIGKKEIRRALESGILRNLENRRLWPYERLYLPCVGKKLFYRKKNLFLLALARELGYRVE